MSASGRRRISSLHGKPAGVVTRTVAGAMDYLLAGTVTMTGYLAITALRFVTRPVGFEWPTTSWLALVLSGMAVLVVYLTVAWSTTGKPLGGSIMGTRVVTKHGHRPGLALSFVRAVIVVAFPVGLLWSAVSPDGRSVQDIALRTRVLYDHDIVTSHPVDVPAPFPPLEQ